MYIVIIYHGGDTISGVAKEILTELESDGNLEGLLGGEEYGPPLTLFTTETHPFGLPSFLSGDILPIYRDSSKEKTQNPNGYFSFHCTTKEL
ncbi:hypothetical protein MRB53_028579 [Persea americana]|uniref:Uncharacterized protein n=1 Tax=Persea americana TaxID=3435 RepID=A0ACC2KGF7_PERAE|nr:hypothetical protein MRB53_028579 [Persea americana]